MRYRSFDERWFRGNHSDIGGSYAEDGLSNITLQWMLLEAGRCGLNFTPTSVGALNAQQPMHDQTLLFPFWAWTGLGSRARAAGEAIDPSGQPVGAADAARRTEHVCAGRRAGAVHGGPGLSGLGPRGGRLQPGRRDLFAGAGAVAGALVDESGR